MDHAIQKMNSRQYSEAIDILEGLYRENPRNSATALLLAQAHLGDAHFEMMELIERIAGQQDSKNPNEYWVEQPTCSDGPIEKLSGFDFRCLLFRLVRHLPEAEHPGVIRAKLILRKAFEDPSRTPSDVNFLAAFVEFSSALYRLRQLAKTESKTLLEQEPNSPEMADAQFKLATYNLKRFLIETQNGLKRLRYSYGKLASFVTHMDGKPMVTIGDHSLIFSENLDTPQILEFASEIVRDRFRSVDDEASYATQRAVQILGIKYERSLARFDRSFFTREHLDELDVYWRFDHLISQLFDDLAYNTDKTFKLKPAELFWRHPPIILQEFKGSAISSWESESVYPLWNYFTTTKDRWNELGKIMDAWGAWFDSDLSLEQRNGIKEYVRRKIKSDRRFSNLPERIGNESVELYGRELCEATSQALQEVLYGKVREIDPLNYKQAERGAELLFWMMNWVNTNLWPVDPAAMGPR